MKKITRKIVSSILSLVVALSSFGMLSTGVYAENTTISVDDTFSFENLSLSGIAYSEKVITGSNGNKITYYENGALNKPNPKTAIVDGESINISNYYYIKTSAQPTASNVGAGVIAMSLSKDVKVDVHIVNDSTNLRNFQIFDGNMNPVLTNVVDVRYSSKVPNVVCSSFVASATGTYYICATGNLVIPKITTKAPDYTTVSGTVTVPEGKSISTLNFTTSTISKGVASASVTNNTYSVNLLKGETYTIECDDPTLIINSSVTVGTESQQTNNINVNTAAAQTVTGDIVGLNSADVSSVSSVTITNTVTNAAIQVGVSNSAYTCNLIPGTYTVSAPTVNGYTLSSLSSQPFTVTVGGNENYKNILYIKNITPATGNVSVGSNKTYTTITDAVAAVEAGITSGAISATASNPVTISIDPGVYEEQVIITKDNIKLINADTTGEVVMTWYYGIDYIYYSCHNGYYNKEYAVDKHQKGEPLSWGSTLVVLGANFYAENITVQNSFNKYMSDAEIPDGVEHIRTNAYDNTVLDRVADADVTLRKSTERAAAVVLNGNANNTEFYNCKFLSSQDTLYTGANNSYFKDCVIAGETDYIFGQGGTSIFDNCELRWCGYGNNVNSNMGYITATRARCIFRNCSVTEATDTDTTVKPTTSMTAIPGYFGRPWGLETEVYFINTSIGSKTADVDDLASAGDSLILNKGWNSMVDVYPFDDTITFREYGNSNGKTTYGYAMTTADYNNMQPQYDSQYFGTWKPANHPVNYADNPNKTYTFDFANKIKDDITSMQDVLCSSLNNVDVEGTAQLSGSYTHVGDGNIDEFTTLAPDTTGSHKGYNTNASSTITFNIIGDDTTVSTIYLTDNAETKTLAANVKKNGVSVGNLAEVSNSGGVYALSVTGAGEYTITFSTAVLLSEFQVTTTGVLSSSIVNNKYQFDFTTSDNATISGSAVEKEAVVTGGTDKGVITIDATNGSFGYEGNNGYGISGTGKITFTLVGEENVSYNTNIEMNIPAMAGTIVLYSGNTEIETVNVITSGLHNITQSLVPGTYDIIFTPSSNKIYCKTVVISTEATLMAPLYPNSYGFEFTDNSGSVTAQQLEYAVDDNTAAIVLDGSEGNFVYNTGNGAQHGYTISPNAMIGFKTVGSETLNNMISINISYVNSGQQIPLKIYSADDTLFANPLVSETVTAAGIYSLAFSGEAGEYILRFEHSGSTYCPRLTIKSSGTLGVQTIPVYTTYTYDFTTGTESITDSEMLMANTETDNTASVKLNGSFTPYTANQSTYGYEIRNGKVYFTLSGEGNIDVTISILTRANAGTVSVYKANDLTNAVATDTSGASLTFTDTAGEYVIVFERSGQTYCTNFSITTTGTLSSETLTAIQLLTDDFEGVSDETSEYELVISDDLSLEEVVDEQTEQLTDNDTLINDGTSEELSEEVLEQEESNDENELINEEEAL